MTNDHELAAQDLQIWSNWPRPFVHDTLDTLELSKIMAARIQISSHLSHHPMAPSLPGVVLGH